MKRKGGRPKGCRLPAEGRLALLYCVPCRKVVEHTFEGTRYTAKYRCIPHGHLAKINLKAYYDDLNLYARRMNDFLRGKK